MNMPAFAQTRQARALPNGITEHASVEGITEFRLQNGLTVLLFPDDSKPLTTVSVTYRVGSKHENYGETGMAHLLEHLLFKGTPSLPDFAQTMQQRGMQWNGTTYFDRTNYYETFSANDDHLRWALTMEADRMVNSFIAKKDLDSEMTVVRNELERGENNPSRILGQRMMSAAFDWHNYAKSTIGAVSDLENVDIARLQAFYKLHYQPDNAVLAVAGRFDRAQTLMWVQDIFGPLAKPTRALPKQYTIEPTQDGERRVTVRRVGDSPQLAIQYHVPAASHPDAAALAVLANVLATEPTGRIYKALNEQGLAASSYAWLNSLAERGVFHVGVGLEAQHDVAKAEAALIRAVQSAGAFSADELKRAQQEWEADFSQILQSPQTLAIALSESIGHGDWRLLFVLREAVKKVSLDDLNRVAAAYLKTDNRTVGQFLPTVKPDRAAIPPSPNAGSIADATQFTAARSAGERFDPTPAALEARTLRTVLPSGMSLSTLTKQNRGDGVQLRIKLRWANSAAVNAAQLHRAAAWVGPMLQEGSIGQSKQALGDTLAELRSKLTLSSGPLGAEITIESTQANLPAVLGLLGPLLKQPLFEPAAFERLRSAALANLAAQTGKPETVAGERIASHSNTALQRDPSDWRYSRNNAEQIADLKAMNIGKVRSAYMQFWTSKHAIISAVGTLPDGLAALLERTLGQWSASPQAAALPFERALTPHQNIPELTARMDTPDKANAVYLAQAAFAMARQHPDYWALQIASSILGGDQFTSRIGKRVRVQEGLSYSAYSYINVDTYDDRALYIASASFAPHNLSKVQTAMREELIRFIAQGITPQELVDTQASLTQALEQQRASDGYLSQHLLYQAETGLTFDIQTQHLQRIASATVASVNAAVKKHFAQLPIAEVLAGDFSKKP